MLCTGETCGVTKIQSTYKHTADELVRKLSCLDGPRREFLKEALAEIATAALNPAGSTRVTRAAAKAAGLSTATNGAASGSPTGKGSSVKADSGSSRLAKGFMLAGGRRKAKVKDHLSRRGDEGEGGGTGSSGQGDLGIAERIRNMTRRAVSRAKSLVVSSDSAASEEQVVLCVVCLHQMLPSCRGRLSNFCTIITVARTLADTMALAF